MDEPRLAIGFGLAAEVADVDLERVGVGAEVVAPDAIEDDLARHDLPGVSQQQLEERELRTCQLHRPVASLHDASGRLEAEISHTQDLLFARVEADAPQQ